MPIVRYPGGNFVSGYNWLDGVGPKDAAADRARARVELDRDEPVRHQRVHRLVRAGRHRAAARHELRHGHASRWPSPTSSTATSTRGTKWSELRRSHGYDAPHNVRYWCLGNEMDGPWQIGQLQAREYGRKARDAAQQMRVIDPNLQLIACGSSGTFMPTYLVWDREVLEECYDQVDGISLHAYYGNTAAWSGNSTRALPGDEPRHGSAHSRDRRGLRLRAGAAASRRKRLWLSFDEWNVWYRARSGARSRTAAGRPRRSCSRRSTTSRTRCSSAASSTRCCAIPIACGSAASRSSSTSSRRS